jgi:hypothetical protein
MNLLILLRPSILFIIVISFIASKAILLILLPIAKINSQFN